MLDRELALAIRALLAPSILAVRWMIPRAGHNYRDLPVARSGPALTAKMFLDELLFSTEVALGKIISFQDCPRISSEVVAAVELYDAQGWLDEPARYHCTPPALKSPRLRREEHGHVRFKHLQFASAYEPHADEPGRARWLSYFPNRTAHAWVLEHRGQPRSWLVCIPGYRMGSPRVDFAGLSSEWLHFRLGLNVVIPVLPFHGPRAVAGRGGDGFLCGDHLDTVHAMAQTVWDVRRILSWVRTRNPPAVGVYGVSLGGYATALLASLDADLDCVIAGIPAVDFSRLAHSHLPPLILWLAERIGLVSQDVERLLRVISPLALVPRVSRERRYLYAGVADRLIPADHVRDLWRHWDRPRLAWYQGGHLSFLWAEEVRALLHEALTASGFLPLPGRKNPRPTLPASARFAA